MFIDEQALKESCGHLIIIQLASVKCIEVWEHLTQFAVDLNEHVICANEFVNQRGEDCTANGPIGFTLAPVVARLRPRA